MLIKFLNRGQATPAPREAAKNATQSIGLPHNGRAPVGVAHEDLPVEIAKLTLRALSRAGAVGQSDANEFYQRWTSEPALQEGDFLESFLSAFGKAEPEMDAIAAKLTVGGNAPLPHCDFLDRLAPVARHSEAREVASKIRKLHCRLLNYHQAGDLATMAIGAFNPVAGAVVAGWLRSQVGANGCKPYVSVMRLFVAEWRTAS